MWIADGRRRPSGSSPSVRASVHPHVVTFVVAPRRDGPVESRIAVRKHPSDRVEDVVVGEAVVAGVVSVHM